MLKFLLRCRRSREPSRQPSTDPRLLTVLFFAAPALNNTMRSRNLNAYQDDADIWEHELRVDASCCIEVDKLAVTSWRFADVVGTPLDFKTERKIGLGENC